MNHREQARERYVKWCNEVIGKSMDESLLRQLGMAMTEDAKPVIYGIRKVAFNKDDFATVRVEQEPRTCSICRGPIVSGRCHCNP